MVSYIELCQDAVRAAGTMLITKLGNVDVRQKAPADLVTDADIAAERIIVELIRDAFPSHRAVGEEETAGTARLASPDEYYWVTDPLDGTTNYAHGVPHFCVSLALIHGRDLLVGGIYDPLRDELFSAVRGEGACLNGQPIRSSRVGRVSDALAGIGFPPSVKEDSPDLRAFLKAVPCFQGLRRTGSAALNMAYVASGRFDAAWSYSTRVWDMAAGSILVREAGGEVSAPDGSVLNPWSGRFLVAATASLHQETMRLLTGVPANPSSG